MKRLALLAALLLVACTSTTEESESSSGQAVGERWTSPILVGSYDGDDQTLFVRSGLQSQEALFMAHDAPVFGSIRVKDGLRMVDEDERTVLSLKQSGGALTDLRAVPPGGEPMDLVLRRPDAVNGRYGHLDSTDYILDVWAGDDNLYMMVGDKAASTYAPVTAVPGKTVGTFQTSAYENCSFSIVREHGEFVFWATDTEYRPANSERPRCALLGKYYPDQHYAPGTAAADTGK